MQFLAYLIVLMVSVSTVLLEVQWLTTPPPQPKPAVHAASAPAPAPKAEGPNAALSPVYPKKPDAVRAPEADSSQEASTSNVSARPGPEMTAAQAPPARPPVAETTASAAPQKPIAETTGVAAREDETKQGVAAAVNAPSRVESRQEVVVQADGAASSNRCDVQACSSAYRSFRASDCTYQPFGAERRFCGKPAMQRTAREQRDEPDRRRWIGDTAPRDVERRAPDIDDEDSPEFEDSERDAPVLFFFGRRARW